ncbi:MFS transporter [Agrococcus versicolor]|uniref:MFS transporter n=2 Tax=Agrococcus versicolor TaxID=501482 RepID=A0ABP5MR01_9MICO
MALVAATYGLVRLAYGLLLPDVQAELGLGVAAAGAASAGASVVYCLCAAVGFVLAARLPRALVAAAATGAAVGAVGMATAGDATVFACSAILASSGAGLASPALVALLQRDRAAAPHPRLQTVVNAGTGPGLVAAAALAMLLPDWRLVWLVAAVVAVAAAVATLLLHRPASAGGSDAALAPSARWLAAHVSAIAGALLLGVGSAAAWSFGRSILVDAGASDTASLVAWVGIGVGGTVVVATARPLERLGPRGAWLLTAGATGAATAALAAGASVTALSLVACVVFGWGYTAASGALIGWTASIDPGRAAAGTAMLFVVLVLGQAVGAAAIGVVAEGVGLAVAFAAAAVVTAGGAAAALVARAPRHAARVAAD